MIPLAIWDIFFEICFIARVRSASAINKIEKIYPILQEESCDNKFITWFCIFAIQKRHFAWFILFILHWVQYGIYCTLQTIDLECNIQTSRDNITITWFERAIWVFDSPRKSPRSWLSARREAEGRQSWPRAFPRDVKIPYRPIQIRLLLLLLLCRERHLPSPIFETFCDF